jgi:hypothetical protein
LHVFVRLCLELPIHNAHLHVQSFSLLFFLSPGHRPHAAV